MSDRWCRRQVLHDVTSSVVCHSLFVTTRNSDLNSGALETAEQSKGMQRYHERYHFFHELDVISVRFPGDMGAMTGAQRPVAWRVLDEFFADTVSSKWFD
jgi:hypothetical protein